MVKIQHMPSRNFRPQRKETYFTETERRGFGDGRDQSEYSRIQLIQLGTPEIIWSLWVTVIVTLHQM